MKRHADTEFTLTVTLTGQPRSGTFFLGGDPTDVPGIEARKRRMADEFERLIARHIQPHFSGDYRLHQSAKREFICSGCGSPWTEKSETYNGGCCAEDEKHNPEAADAASQPAE